MFTMSSVFNIFVKGIYMNFGERVVKARELLGFNQSEFAERIELAAQSLARYEKNKVKPSVDFITKLTNMFNINSNWLLTGKGEMLLKDKNRSLKVNGSDNVTINGDGSSISDSFKTKRKSKKASKEEKFQNIISIPYFQDTYAAAGHGAINYDEVPHPVSFDKSFLQKQFGIIAVKNIHIINAIGNSMEPTIREGELLMVNPFENENMNIKDGGIYIVSCNNSILVKRIKHNPINGKITLISDNKEYEDIHVSKEEFESCHIVGRVVGHFDKI